MNEFRMRKFMASLSLLATGSLFAVSGYSQTAATTTNSEPELLEKFEVTGSYLTPAANAVAIPVISVDSKAIENSGSNSDVLEILRKTVPQFSGNSNLGSSNANVGSGSTAGGSQIALRNAQTLVLINGRRVAYAPVGGSGGFQFVDVNMIPVAAIERIEVLPDGASAIYGSDAVSGVVNIILKTDYQGFEVGGRYGWATSKGKMAERSAYLVGGAGNGKTSITVSAEWIKTDPIYAYERPYSAVTYGTPTFAGSVNIGSAYYFLNPTLGAPTGSNQTAAGLVGSGVYSGPRTSSDQFALFNLSQYVTQTIGNERQGMTLALDHKVNDRVTFFGDFMYTNTQTFSQINGQPLNIGGINPGEYGNPFDVTATPRNRLVTDPRAYFYDTTGVRGTAGLKGMITENWSWEVAAVYNRIQQDHENPGVINNGNLIAAVEAGAFNMFARDNDPAVYGPYNIVGTATNRFVSTLANYDAKVRGKLFELPAGSVDAAFGAEVRSERLSGNADPLSIPDADGNIGWNGATSVAPFKASRRVESLFAEVRVPLLAEVAGAHLLEVSGAVRHEIYSDTSDPTVPKVTLRYLPFDDQFAMRATFSKSFSAPQLYYLFGPSGIGYTAPFTLTPNDGSADIDNVQTLYQTVSNPGLEPSRSTNYTAGVVYSPKGIKGFSVSVDYWNIKQTGLVSSIDASTILQDVEDKGSASQYASRVKVGSFNGAAITAPGQISTAVFDDIYVTNPYANLSKVNLDGVDVKLKYIYNPDNIGRFEFESNIGIYNKYDIVLQPGEAPIETAGYSTIDNGTIPRWSSYTSVDYTRGNWGGFIGWQYLPSLTNYDTGDKLSAFNSFDLRASYNFGPSIKYLAGARLSIGVNNVFNKFGPLDPTVNTDANVDIGTYGARGRFVYIDLKYKF